MVRNMKKKYLYRLDLKVKSPLYIRGNTCKEAEDKVEDRATLVITNINRKRVGGKRWYFPLQAEQNDRKKGRNND